MKRKIVDTYACGHSVERDSEDVIVQLFGFAEDQPEHINSPCCVCLAAEARLARQNRINAYVEAEQLRISSLCGDINKDFGAMLKKLNKPFTSQEIDSHPHYLTVYHYTSATGAKITAVERFVDSFSWPLYSFHSHLPADTIAQWFTLEENMFNAAWHSSEWREPVNPEILPEY